MLNEIKPGQVLKEVIAELRAFLTECDCDDCVSVAIAAALNAWPGMWLEDRDEINLGAEVEPLVHHARVVLPLPQEMRDDE